jgi:hypothetical protein
MNATRTCKACPALFKPCHASCMAKAESPVIFGMPTVSMAKGRSIRPASRLMRWTRKLGGQAVFLIVGSAMLIELLYYAAVLSKPLHAQPGALTSTPFLPTPAFNGPALSLSSFSFRANGNVYTPTQNLQLGLNAASNASGLVVISISSTGYEVFATTSPGSLYVSEGVQLNPPQVDLTAIPLYMCTVYEGQWRYCQGPPRYITFAAGPQARTVYGISPAGGTWGLDEVTGAVSGAR